MKSKGLASIVGALLIILVLVGGWFYAFKMDRSIEPFTYFDENQLESQAVCLMERETGEVIYGFHEDEKRAPASLTKILTALVAIEQAEDLEEEVPVDTPSYQMMVDAQASMAGFYGGEMVTINDLLYGTILSSGGEAAMSLATVTVGSQEEFVDLMNRRMYRIPLESSQFVNTSGMDAEGQYSTAKDICKLTKEALENPTFYRVFTQKLHWTTKTADHPEGILLESTVLGKIPPSEHQGYRVLGGKSGTTMQAGLCWTTLVEVNETQYILTTMGAPREKEDEVPQWHDAKLIFEELIEPAEKDASDK